MSNASISCSACTVLKSGAFWTRLFKPTQLFCLQWIRKYSVTSDNRAAGLKLLGARREKVQFCQLKMSLLVKSSACPMICGLMLNVSHAWTLLCSPAQLLPSLLNPQKKKKKTRLNYSVLFLQGANRMRGRLGSVDSFERCNSLASDKVCKELSYNWHIFLCRC